MSWKVLHMYIQIRARQDSIRYNTHTHTPYFPKSWWYLPFPSYDESYLEVGRLNILCYEWSHANEYSIGWINQTYKFGTKLAKIDPYRGVGDDRYKWPKRTTYSSSTWGRSIINSVNTKDLLDFLVINSMSNSCKMTIHLEYFLLNIWWVRVHWTGLMSIIIVVSYKSISFQNHWTTWKNVKVNFSTCE